MQQLLGSGKTAVLVERIVRKIIDEKIDIDNLLVVTFTNAAASEMRERILREIYKLLDSDSQDEELNLHLQKQTTLINKANICTIDSFCLDVIRNNFFVLDISPNFRIAENTEIELLKQEALDKIFEEKYEGKDKDFEKLIKTYTSYRDDTPLKDLILKIYNYIQSNPYPLEWLNFQIEKFNIQDVTIDFSNTAWGKILLKSMQEELEDDIKKLKSEQMRLSVEKELEAYERVISSDISQLEMLKQNLDNWDKACNISQTQEFLKWPASRKITNLEKENAKQIRDKVKKSFTNKRDKIFVQNSIDTNKDLIEMYEVLVKLQNLIILFDEEFKKSKKEKNVLDFSDIEHLALEILTKNKEIAKKYQEKFVEIAIDEYQDSNLVQEYILNSISRSNNIFMVGDVKQSIYKFRQADPSLFLVKYKNYQENNEMQVNGSEEKENKVNEQENNQNEKDTNEDGLKIKLFKNFRSRKNVLDFTNLIFQSIMGEKLGEIEYTEEEYLNLGANYEESKEELITEVDILHVLDETEDANSQNEEGENQNTSRAEEYSESQNIDEDEIENIEDIELEAKFVANKIKKLIDNKFQIYDNKKENFRNIEPKDIVILLRSTKNKANIFEKELIAQNIAVYSDVSSEYLDSYEIQIIMDLLKIIDNPYQDIPLCHIMLSAIFMFTEDDLLEIRLYDNNDDFYTAILKSRLSVRDELREKIENFLNKIQSWREKNNILDLDELIWTIYEETGFLNYVGLMPNGTLRQANLKKLFEKAKQYETASFKGLFNFINFIENVKISGSDLGAAKIIGENENVVRIMSIHKSKGLEFPIVFLSCTNSSFNMMDLNADILLHKDLGIGVKYIDYDKQIKYDTLTKLALREKMLEENLAEEMRILYVALTRAKEKIYITGVKKDFEESKKSMQELVDIYKLENGKISPILLKKYKRYIDWILLVSMYMEDAKNQMKINVLKKKEILKELKQEKQEKKDIFKILEENSENVKTEDVLDLKNKLAFEYKYMDLRKIPTKESVTNIAHKTISQNQYEFNIEDEVEDKLIEQKEEIENEGNCEESNNQNVDNGISSKKQEFIKPKFIIGTEEEKIDASKKGTLMHLCMKNLDFSKNYNLQDIIDMIEDLKSKNIITEKESENINVKAIFEFTKSNIWSDLKQAKEYHKEEPFYMNIPAKEVMNSSVDENILVQGIIDLYYITKDDELVLLDYKTDSVKMGEEKVLIERHREQLMLYKRALEESLGRKVAKVYIYSTNLNKEIALE